MVTLDKIYTRGGDKGETSLADGSRIAKHNVRIKAFGAVDEANAILGVARLHMEKFPLENDMLARIQNDLFDLGADLARPITPQDKKQRMDESYVRRLEKEIDSMNDDLEPLRSFILPGGTLASSFLHVARTIIRRAEGLAHETHEAEGNVNGQVTIYLNRLSDHLFVLARRLNDNGKKDVLWAPGASQGAAK